MCIDAVTLLLRYISKMNHTLRNSSESFKITSLNDQVTDIFRPPKVHTMYSVYCILCGNSIHARILYMFVNIEVLGVASLQSSD